MDASSGNPSNLLLILAPGMAMTQAWEQKNQQPLREIVETYDPMMSKEEHRTIFLELLGSDILPAEEKSFDRLWQEGSALLGAGVETTSNILNVALYHLLLLHPSKLALLKEELTQAMPDENELTTWAALEKLPYLVAVIKESLRLALGTTSRFIRVAPDRKLTYEDHSFLPGTTVSMSSLLLAEHADLFSNPADFLP
jgi:cytochrome P450